MKKTLAFGCLCLLLAGTSGCSASPDGLVQEQIKAMNDLAEAFEKNEPESKIAEIKARMEETTKKLDALKLSEEDKKKLLEKHKEEMMKAVTRMTKAMMGKAMQNMGSIPGMPSMPKP